MIEGSDQEWLDLKAPELGLVEAKVIGDGLYAGLLPKIYTTALITGEIGDESQYLDHWCYDSREAASRALQVWDGTGEPTGWHRHPSTGRRVSQTGFEIDDQGNQVSGVG